MAVPWNRSLSTHLTNNINPLLESLRKYTSFKSKLCPNAQILHHTSRGEVFYDSILGKDSGDMIPKILDLSPDTDPNLKWARFKGQFLRLDLIPKQLKV